MGIAAYNRGSNVISKQLDSASRPVEFEVIERLNEIHKYKDAGKPFGPVSFVPGNNGFWAECQTTGFGFWYPTLAEAVRRWRVTIVAFNNGTWEATHA